MSQLQSVAESMHGLQAILGPDGRPSQLIRSQKNGVGSVGPDPGVDTGSRKKAKKKGTHHWTPLENGAAPLEKPAAAPLETTNQKFMSRRTPT
ncbi:MAG: hypothetical protein JWP34_999 [Massilia sp.]|nr:hypothetical protein [Massilia sp.]